MSDLPERLRSLADAIEGLDWELPVTAREDCRRAADEIERLRAVNEQAADDYNWRAIVTEALTHSVDEISNGRARDIIHELRVALLPFSALHAAMHKYYDSDSGHVPDSVKVPREWLADAYCVLKEGLAND